MNRTPPVHLEGETRAVQCHTSRGFVCLTIRSGYDVTPPKAEDGLDDWTYGYNMDKRRAGTGVPPPELHGASSVVGASGGLSVNSGDVFLHRGGSARSRTSSSNGASIRGSEQQALI
jgi:hypothetical protein